MHYKNNMTKKFAASDGTEFYYEVVGEGRPLVLLHAGIADSRMWDEQFATFAQHYRVVRYDLRGYGQTALVDNPYSHHADLLQLLNYLDIPQAQLCGCSMGGTTALDFALAYPARTSALVLVACQPSGDEFVSKPPPQREEMYAKFDAGDYAGVAELEVQMWVDGPHRTPDQVDTALRQRVREMDTITLRNEALELGEYQPLDPPAATRLEQVRVPTLIISGDLDRPAMIHAAELMGRTIAGAQTAVITGTAHLPSMEQPILFNQLVLNFLAKL